MTKTSVERLTRRDFAWIVATLLATLAIDVRVSLLGQTLLGICCWGVVAYVLDRVAPGERPTLLACLVIATLAEVIGTLVWGLYTYRLGNIPLFVPPGHVLMLVLGLALERRITPQWIVTIYASAACYAMLVAAIGLDTTAPILLAVLLGAAWIMPGHRALYAATFVLGLGLELVGTALGNWRWESMVPGTALVTTNPPGLSGAFYCMLDCAVALAVTRAAARRALAGVVGVRLPRTVIRN